MKDYMVLDYDLYQDLITNGLLCIYDDYIVKTYDLIDDIVYYSEYLYCYHNPGYKHFDKFVIGLLRVRVKAGRND